MSTFASDRWYDGTYWEVSVPDGWRAWQDRTVDGFPYRFESGAGSWLQIGVSKHVRLNGYRDDAVSRRLRSEDERRAYLIARSSAWIRQAPRYPLLVAVAWSLVASLLQSAGMYPRPQLTRFEAGWLKGYLVRSNGDRRDRYEGAFAFREWTLYAYFFADKERFDHDAGQAIAILGSLQFRA